MNRSMRAVLLAVLALMLTATACERSQPKRLEEVFSPRFARVPPPIPAREAIAGLAADWRSGGRDQFWRELRSSEGAALATGLGVVLLVGWNRRATLPGPSIDYLLLFLGGAWFFGAMRFFAHLGDADYLWLKDLVFTLVVVTGLAMIARALLSAVRGPERVLRPRMPTAALVGLAAVLLAADIAMALARPPDDAGWFVNLGGQRLRERGRLPYGDPLLTGTPGAAYGPLLYAAHVPFQLAVAPSPVNRESPSQLDLADEQHPYFLPPVRATQLCAVAFHLVGVLALFLAARNYSNVRTAVGMVCLYCGSLAVLGIGGPEESLSGMTFISHIAPASMTLLAFALLDRPAWSGFALVAAAGVGFYPIFMTPAWVGFYWRDHRALASFLAACTLASALLLTFVYQTSRPHGELSRLQTFVSDTLGHHTDPDGYGRSPFGFWGQQTGWRAWLQQPLAGSSPMASPLWLAFFALLLLAGLVTAGRDPAALALVLGAVALAATLVKPHATGTYLTWYYGLLLLGFGLPRFTSTHKIL